MIPGPNYIYQCPTCSNLMYHESLASGNTFNAAFYSDGKLIAPDLPAYPTITKCTSCRSLLWVGHLDPVASCEPEDMDGSEWAGAKEMQFLDLFDLLIALDQGYAKMRNEKIYIRQQILWSFNDQIRAGHPLYRDQEDQYLWNSNIDELLLLLGTADDNHLFLMAELLRYRRKFRQAVDLLKTIDDPKLKGYVAKLVTACEMEVSTVIRLE